MFKGPFRAILVKEPKGQTGGMSYHSQSQVADPRTWALKRNSLERTGLSPNAKWPGTPSRSNSSDASCPPGPPGPRLRRGLRAPGHREAQGSARRLGVPKELGAPVTDRPGFGKRKDVLRKPQGIVQGVKHSLLASVTQVSG